jgi:hypothetical protein
MPLESTAAVMPRQDVGGVKVVVSTPRKVGFADMNDTDDIVLVG